MVVGRGRVISVRVVLNGVEWSCMDMVKFFQGACQQVYFDGHCFICVEGVPWFKRQWMVVSSLVSHHRLGVLCFEKMSQQFLQLDVVSPFCIRKGIFHRFVRSLCRSNEGTFI